MIDIKVGREHLDGLELAVKHIGSIASKELNQRGLLAELQQIIAQASAAPEQEPHSKEALKKLLAQVSGACSRVIEDGMRVRLDLSSAREWRSLSTSASELLYSVGHCSADEQEPVAYCDDFTLDILRRGAAYSIGVEPATSSRRSEGAIHALYTHVDPAEVERLQAELKEADRRVEDYGLDACNAREERDAATQRADEAERKLGEVVGAIGRIAANISAELKAIEQLKGELLSASEEPAKGGDGE